MKWPQLILVNVSIEDLKCFEAKNSNLDKTGSSTNKKDMKFDENSF